MPTDIEKFLAKVTEKEKKILAIIIEKIIEGDFNNLDVKKLAGHDDIYRIRKGNFRIIFKTTKTDIRIVSIERRADTTYNF